ncbi:MAG: hypothetical protein MJ185_02925 [Treponema sp.]|nr:hypothetical protein [Treponema sp.]
MKKIMTITAAVLAVLMMISCNTPVDNTGDNLNGGNNSSNNQSSDKGKDTEGSKDSENQNSDKENNDSENDSEEKILDFLSVRQYEMKVGDTVNLPETIDDCEVYYEIQSGSDVISFSGNVLSADSVGDAVLKAVDWKNDSHYWAVSISVTAEGFNGSALEYKLVGNWGKVGDLSSLVLNLDKTGSMENYLNGNLIQDWSFTWSAFEAGGNKYLSLDYYANDSGETGNKQLTITRISDTSMVLDGYLGFGTPKINTWNKE